MSNTDKIAKRRKVLEERMKKYKIPSSSMIVGGEHEVYEFIPIGIPEIDSILETEDLEGNKHNGLLRGTIIEFCGLSQSGKTYSSFHLAKEYQKRGLRVLYIDAEGAYYEPRAVQLGVNIEDPDLREVLSVQVSAGTIGDYLIESANSGDYGLIILDSIATLIPDDDFEKSLEDADRVGSHAKFTNRLLKRLNSSNMKELGTTVVIINQFRSGSSGMPGQMMDRSTGGKAVEYYSRIRLWFRKINGAKGKVIDAEGNTIGGKSECTCQKTKTGGQDKSTVFNVMFVQADNDPVGEFLFTVVKNKEFSDLVKHTKSTGETEKRFKYIDPDTGELLSHENAIEFVKLLKEASPPSKRTPKSDSSSSMYEYVLKRLKYKDAQIEELEQELTKS
jgi:RecA/RadA recombinase